MPDGADAPGTMAPNRRWRDHPASNVCNGGKRPSNPKIFRCASEEIRFGSCLYSHYGCTQQEEGNVTVPEVKVDYFVILD